MSQKPADELAATTVGSTAHKEAKLDVSLDGTFPASDPPSVTRSPTKAKASGEDVSNEMADTLAAERERAEAKEAGAGA